MRGPKLPGSASRWLSRRLLVDPTQPAAATGAVTHSPTAGALDARPPVRPSPMAGESPTGFALRVSLACGYPHPNWLPQLASETKVEWGSFYRGQDTRHLLVSMGIPVADAKRLSGTDAPKVKFSVFGDGPPVHARLIDRNNPKVCRACVNELPFMRAVWSLRLWTVCPIHGHPMEEACPDCGEKHGWFRRRLDGGCKTRPGAWSPVGEDLASIDFVRCIARAASFDAPPPSEQVHSLIGSLGIRDLSMLTHRVSAIATFDGFGKLTLRSTWTPTLEQASSAIAATSCFLKKWPESFHDVIERVWRSSSSKDTTAKPDRDFFVERFMHLFMYKRFAFVRREFGSHLNERFPAAVKRRARKPMRPRDPVIPVDSGVMGIAAVGQALGFSKEAVHRFAWTGRIQASHYSARRRRIRVVERSEVLDVRRRERLDASLHQARVEAGAMSRAEVAARLGVQRGRMDALVAAGFVGERSVSVHFKRFYDRRVIDELLERLEARREPVQTGHALEEPFGENEDARFRPLLGIFGGHSLPELLRVIIDHGIAPDHIVAGGIGLGRLAYEERTVERIRFMLSSRHFTQERASIALGCSIVSVMAFLDAGVLATAPNVGEPRPQRSGVPKRILAASVLSVADRFVSTSGLARALHKHPKGLSLVLRDIDIVPEVDLGTVETTLWPRDLMVAAMRARGFPVTSEQLDRSGRPPKAE